MKILRRSWLHSDDTEKYAQHTVVLHFQGVPSHRRFDTPRTILQIYGKQILCAIPVNTNLSIDDCRLQHNASTMDLQVFRCVAKLAL